MDDEVLMEDLIDYNIEETIGVPHSSWTEQALDLFISILKNVKKAGKYSSQREMLEIIAFKMTERNYKFSVDQIEKKYNSLKKMYTDKKERNQSVEPELCKLFGDSKSSPQHEQPPQKRFKLDITEDSIQSLDAIPDEEKKFLWSTEATKIFLGLLEQLRPQLGSKLRTKKQMWEEICRRLKAHGFNFTSPQVENKWKALLRHYRGRLELMRNEGTARSSVFSKLAHNYSAWPEFFESSMRKRNPDLDISFANDQKLPYEDDGYTDEEPYQLEEIPSIEIVSEEIDPVMVEDVKPTSQQLGEKTSNESPNSLELSLSQIVKEIASFREDNQKHQNELLQIEKMKLKAYKERTVQFTRIADGLSNFLKRKSDEDV